MNNLSYFLDTCPNYIKNNFVAIWAMNNGKNQLANDIVFHMPFSI